MNALVQEEATTIRKADPLLGVAGKYLTFKLGEEAYGIAVLKIREIIRIQKITPIPRMPAHVKGVINLRGKVIPIIDLRVRFNIGSEDMNDRSCIVVVQVNLANNADTSVGLVVDAVEEVVNIEPNQIEPTPELGQTFESEFVLGIAKIKGDVKTLLDIDKVIGEGALGY